METQIVFSTKVVMDDRLHLWGTIDVGDGPEPWEALAFSDVRRDHKWFVAYYNLQPHGYSDGPKWRDALCDHIFRVLSEVEGHADVRRLPPAIAGLPDHQS